MEQAIQFLTEKAIAIQERSLDYILQMVFQLFKRLFRLQNTREGRACALRQNPLGLSLLGLPSGDA
jgi:hypothetical protein